MKPISNIDVIDKYISSIDNSKKLMSYIDIPNKSHYLDSHSKRSFRLKSPTLLSVQKNRQLGYYVRCMYHHQYVESQGGFTLFYTLTYNNKSLPKFGNVPCFNYNDLRYLLNKSGFDKKLQRVYGYTLQYLITCELGDGKGVRGMAGNPHYHCLFFLIPKREAGKNYLTLDAKVFRRLIRNYWCGNSSDPNEYRYGICMPGDNDGVVNSHKAIYYVCKYVLKNIAYYQLYFNLKSEAINRIFARLSTMRSAQNVFRRYLQKNPRYINYYSRDIPDVAAFLERMYERLYKKDIRNIYMPKVRISQGVGLSALDSLNSDGDTINIVRKGIIEAVRIPMYLYRKLYYDVVKDAKGNRKYVLNEKGIEHRMERFDFMFKNEVSNIKSILEYSGMSADFSDDVIVRYVYYDKIYRDRICPDLNREIDPISDYYAFSFSEFYSTCYKDDEAVSAFFSCRSFFLYCDHPFFKDFTILFSKLDIILDKYYICANKAQWEDYNAIERTRKFFSTDKFNKYLASL